MENTRGCSYRRWLVAAIAAVAAMWAVVIVAAPAAAQTAPVITSVEGGCTLSGGGQITVTGSYLLGATGATIGGKAVSINAPSSVSATVTCPPQVIAGFYNLIINVSGDYSNLYPIPTSASGRPSVADVSPDRGSIGGGTKVTITGQGFIDGVDVRFGDTIATCDDPTSDVKVTCTAPAAADEGVVDVVVLNSHGPSFYTEDDRFTYTTGPAIASITTSPASAIPASAPASGSPNTSVTITGSNLAHATSVAFGDTILHGDDFNADDTSIEILVTFAHAPDVVDVTVTTPDGTTTVPDAFRFIGSAAPKITAITPVTGPSGTVVSFTGSGFAAVTSVTFDDIPSTDVHVTSDTALTATVPVGTNEGAVDVAVVTSNGTATKQDAFTVLVSNAPQVTTLSPKTGSAGTQVVILGDTFSDATKVTFDGIEATFTINSDTSITATAPHGMSEGDVDVVVSNAAGSSQVTDTTVFTNTVGSLQTIVLQGRFSLVAWVGEDGMAVGDALAGGPAGPQDGTTNVASKVASVWSFDSANGKWLGYFPSAASTPGANDLTTLTFGGGYFISLNDPSAGPVNWVVARQG